MGFSDRGMGKTFGRPDGDLDQGEKDQKDGIFYVAGKMGYGAAGGMGLIDTFSVLDPSRRAETRLSDKPIIFRMGAYPKPLDTF
jgi:hypothetical protein